MALQRTWHSAADTGTYGHSTRPVSDSLYSRRLEDCKKHKRQQRGTRRKGEGASLGTVWQVEAVQRSGGRLAASNPRGCR